MLGLAVATPGDVVDQHREVIRDDQVAFLIHPGLVRQCVRILVRILFVITDVRQPTRWRWGGPLANERKSDVHGP